MDNQQLLRLAHQLVGGQLPADDFVARLSASGLMARSIADLGEVQLDLDRRRRCGYSEVIYGENKTVKTLEKTFRALLEAGGDALATRISPEQAEPLSQTFPQGHYNPLARTFRISRAADPPRAQGHVVIVTAGTTDLPVAEEARETALWMGASVHLVQDVGVAGPQRLLARLPEIHAADAVVVVAGMEGALPSVVGGHVSCPVIAVPTSTGYGANLGGMVALLGMLTSCAANVTVVNIDAGFKGGYVAAMIARLAAREPG